jgi:hypothetical protein
MSRLKIGISLAALAALALTGLAVADENKPTAIVSVTAHFTASGDVNRTTCPATVAKNVPSNVVAALPRLVTRAQLSGTSTSTEKQLNGPVRISLRTVVNAGGIGTATGTFRIPGKIEAELVAVVSSGNRYDGFIRTTSNRRLFANFSATAGSSPTNAKGAMLTGDLGSGGHLNTAVFGRGGCQGQ